MSINLNNVLRDMQAMRLSRYEMQDKYGEPRNRRILSDNEDARQLDNASRYRDWKGGC